MAEVWTHGRWLVAPGREDEFVQAWQEFAEWTTTEFPAARGVLLRDRERPNRFYSFGPWESVDDVERWRASSGFEERVGRIRELLESFEPFTLESAATVGDW